MKNKVKKSIVVLMAIIFVSSCGKDESEPIKELKKGPNHDAVVIYRNYDTKLADTNYGDINRMFIAEATNGSEKYTSYQSYIDFGDIKNASKIESAQLYLYHTINPDAPKGPVFDNEGDNAFEVYCVKDNWDESSITWNTKPVKDDAINPVSVEASIGNEDFVIDVTSLVKASAKANFMMTIKEGTAGQTDWVWLSTKENLESSVRPTLIIKYKN